MQISEILRQAEESEQLGQWLKEAREWLRAKAQERGIKIAPTPNKRKMRNNVNAERK